MATDGLPPGTNIYVDPERLYLRSKPFDRAADELQGVVDGIRQDTAQDPFVSTGWTDKATEKFISEWVPALNSINEGGQGIVDQLRGFAERIRGSANEFGQLESDAIKLAKS